MARVGENESKQANQQEAAQQQKAFATGQAAVANYNQGERTLEKGGEVGANPYLSPQYLASVNRLQAGTLDAENNAAKTNIQALNRRTGGMNGTATTGAISDLALRKMRMGDELSSERSAGDYGKNLNWQQQLLQSRLAPAGVETPYYSASTQGRGDAIKTMSQFGLQSQAFWNDIANKAIQSAGTAVAGA